MATVTISDNLLAELAQRARDATDRAFALTTNRARLANLNYAQGLSRAASIAFGEDQDPDGYWNLNCIAISDELIKVSDEHSRYVRENGIADSLA
jgi:hypothetical protein